MQKLKSFFFGKVSAQTTCDQDTKVHISNKRACSGDRCKRTICNHCNSKSNNGFCMTCSDALDLDREQQTGDSKLDTVDQSEETKKVKRSATAGSIPYIHLTKK